MTTQQRTPSSSARMAALVDGLDLTPLEKQVLRERWLDQITWLGGRAQRYHFRWVWFIRVPLIVGGALVPAFVTILLASGTAATVPWLFNVDVSWVRLAAFGASLAVAIASSSEQALSVGDQWRHYRRTAELLKSTGWLFLTLAGPFRRFPTHAEAFGPFMERVEQLLSEDLEGYLGLVSHEPADAGRREVIV